MFICLIVKENSQGFVSMLPVTAILSFRQPSSVKLDPIRNPICSFILRKFDLGLSFENIYSSKVNRILRLILIIN